jgi:hypothetical protein
MMKVLFIILKPNDEKHMVLARFLFIFLMLSAGNIGKTSMAQAILPVYEDSLKVLAKEMQGGRDDFVRLQASDRFAGILMRALEKEDSFGYPFDSLVSISKITSDDQRVRIFTWAVEKNDGNWDFGGILQCRPKQGKTSISYLLEDHSSEIANPESQVLGVSKWYGALYYKMIEQSFENHVYYTLLGWDGNNAVSRKKLIEVLTLSPSGKPSFGASIFIRFPRKCKRVIFEYSANTSMTLNFSVQMIDVRVKKGKKRILKKETSEMIVFDRLAPMNPSLEGQYQFYFPETNILDGFIFEKGRWNYVKEVDARNDPRKTILKRKKPEYELFPEQKENKK